MSIASSMIQIGRCLLFTGGIISGCVNNRMQAVVPSPLPCALPDTISFQRNILPIFQTNCALSGCHSGNFPTGNLNLEASKAYSQLLKKGSGYVDTLHPENSVLYSSLVSISDPMPPTGSLDPCKIEEITTWMRQKARNN